MNARMPVVVLASVIVVAGGVAVALKKSKAADPPNPPEAAVLALSVSSTSSAKPLLASEKQCEGFRDAYQRELAKVQSCTTDDECEAGKSVPQHAGLDGCARFTRRGANTLQVQAAAMQWEIFGCSHTFMTCRQPLAKCEENRCVELPPSPLPRRWQRYTYRNYFSFFGPPNAQKQEVMGEDSEVGEWTTPKYSIEFDYGYGVDLSAHREDGDVAVTHEPFTSGAFKGEFFATRKMSYGLSGVTLREVNMDKERSSLTLFIRCSNWKDCADGKLISQSLELH